MVVVSNGKDRTVYQVDNTLVIGSILAVVGNGSHSRTTHERTVYDCHTGPKLVQILTLVCRLVTVTDSEQTERVLNLYLCNE